MPTNAKSRGKSKHNGKVQGYYLPHALIAKIQELAVREDRSASNIVTRAVTAYAAASDAAHVGGPGPPGW